MVVPAFVALLDVVAVTFDVLDVVAVALFEDFVVGKTVDEGEIAEVVAVVLLDGFTVVEFEGIVEVILFAVFVVAEFVVAALAIDADAVVTSLDDFVAVTALGLEVFDVDTVVAVDGVVVELPELFVVLMLDDVLFDERLAATVCWMKLVIAKVFT